MSHGITDESGRIWVWTRENDVPSGLVWDRAWVVGRILILPDQYGNPTSCQLEGFPNQPD